MNFIKVVGSVLGGFFLMLMGYHGIEILLHLKNTDFPYTLGDFMQSIFVFIIWMRLSYSFYIEIDGNE